MRVPDLNWPTDLFKDVDATPSSSRAFGNTIKERPLWSSMREL